MKEFIDTDIPKRAKEYAQLLDAWQKKVAMARMILLEGVQNHIVSSLHGKATPYAIWKDLKNLFQSGSEHRKLTLKDKLKNIKKEESETIPTYLAKFTHVDMSLEVLV